MKLPPIEKIYEAYSAIADNRVTIMDTHASVQSSDRQKTYTVNWTGQTFSSNDSATYWQGYAGYPVIAVLMLQGKLTFNEDIATLFQNVNWTELNKKHKQDYSKAVDEVIDGRGYNREQITNEATQIYEQLKSLDIAVKRSSTRSPK